MTDDEALQVAEMWATLLAREQVRNELLQAQNDVLRIELDQERQTVALLRKELFPMQEQSRQPGR